MHILATIAPPGGVHIFACPDSFRKFAPKACMYIFGQGYGLLYEILTRYGPERSRENERIARAILDGLRLHRPAACAGNRWSPNRSSRNQSWGVAPIETRVKRQVGDRIPGLAAGFGDGGLDGGRYGDGRLGGDGYGDGRPGGGGGDRYGDGGSGGGRYTASRRRQAGRRG